jgi:dolichol-phosphate mannosyltransferase
VSNKIVIIPTYNEKENIQKMLDTVLSVHSDLHVLVVDDNSPDGTGSIVEDNQKVHPQRLHLLKRTNKNGLGTAYIAGFRWCLEKHYEYICEMDCDFSHNPKDLAHLIEACEIQGADMCIGSRYVTGVNVVNWPMGRVLMSYYASAYVRIITGMKIRDTTAGFVCYTRKVLETIDLNKIRFKGYAFQIEMKFKAWRNKFKIVEVPIIFTDRTEGTSKMTKGIFKEAVFGVIEMKIKSLFSKP